MIVRVLLVSACLALGLGALLWTRRSAPPPAERASATAQTPPPIEGRTAVAEVPVELPAEVPAEEVMPATPAAEDAPDPSEATFRTRLQAARATATKASLGAVLANWRTGTLTLEQDRAIDDVIAAHAGGELDKAAAHLLLGVPSAPAQRQALAALLADSGSEHAVGALLEAAKEQRLAGASLTALATVSEPGALPRLSRAIEPNAPPELLDAIARALRNVDTPKARDLEARLAELR